MKHAAVELPMGGRAGPGVPVDGRGGSESKFEGRIGGQRGFGGHGEAGAPDGEILGAFAKAVQGGDDGGVAGDANGERHRDEAERARCLHEEAKVVRGQFFDGEKRVLVLGGVEAEVGAAEVCTSAGSSERPGPAREWGQVYPTEPGSKNQSSARWWRVGHSPESSTATWAGPRRPLKWLARAKQ